MYSKCRHTKRVLLCRDRTQTKTKTLENHHLNYVLSLFTGNSFSNDCPYQKYVYETLSKKNYKYFDLDLKIGFLFTGFLGCLLLLDIAGAVVTSLCATLRWCLPVPRNCDWSQLTLPMANTTYGAELGKTKMMFLYHFHRDLSIVQTPSSFRIDR